MAAKELVFDESARRALERGANLRADAVRVTLGPNGRHVVRDKKVDTKEKIAQVASISANDKDIGDFIADAMEKVGKDGVITVEESKSMKTEVETKDGMQFDKGYISPYMATDMERMEAVLDDPYI